MCSDSLFLISASIQWCIMTDFTRHNVRTRTRTQLRFYTIYLRLYMHTQHSSSYHDLLVVSQVGFPLISTARGCWFSRLVHFLLHGAFLEIRLFPSCGACVRRALADGCDLELPSCRYWFVLFCHFSFCFGLVIRGAIRPFSVTSEA